MVKTIKKNPSIRLKELLVYAKKINIKVRKNKNRSSTRTIRILDFKGIISEIIPKIRAAISRAAVQEGVMKAFKQLNFF